MPPDSFESGLFVLVDSTGREPGQAKAGYHHEGDILPFDILNKTWYTRLSSTTRNLEILCMKKKMLCPIVIVIAFLICCIVYFKPLSLSDVAEADNQMKMIYSQIGVENGEAYIDSVNYQDITIDQKNAILSLLDKYTYRRTVGTLFSNGSTSDLGNKTLSIYVYDDDLLINSVFATSSGKVVINEKTYNMEDAERFIEQMIEIMN